MATYISQKQAREERHQLRITRKKLKLAKEAIETVVKRHRCNTPGCACCTPESEYEYALCWGGEAQEVLWAIKGTR